MFVSHLWRIDLNVLGYQSHLLCNIAILPVVKKDLPISPRFSTSTVLEVPWLDLFFSSLV